MLIYVNVRVWFFGSFSHIRSTVIPRSFFWQWNDRISRSNFWLAFKYWQIWFVAQNNRPVRRFLEITSNSLDSLLI